MNSYIVHENSDLALLVRKVNEYLLLGWVCQGGIAISNVGGSRTNYAQAMIKKENSNA